MLKFTYNFEIHLYHNKKEKFKLFRQRDKVTRQVMKAENPVYKIRERKKHLHT